jgi:hypothetical protein
LSKRAPLFREHLRAAKLTRERLFENTATTLMVNFRSLRDSGITWLALAGVELPRMQRRAGHDNIQTTLGYVKMAEDLTGKIGAPFAPLPFAPATATNGSAGRWSANGPAMGQEAAIRNEAEKTASTISSGCWTRFELWSWHHHQTCVNCSFRSEVLPPSHFHSA